MPHHANSGSFKPGHQTWIKDKTHSPETRQKLRANALKPESIRRSITNLPLPMRGKANPNWRGGYYKQCPVCGQDFWVRPSTEAKEKYCSNECKAENQKLIFRGESNPNWRGGHYKNCEYCGKKIWVMPFNEKTHKYCSSSCKAKAERTFARLNNDPSFQQKRLKAAIKKPNRQEQKLETILEKWFPGEWKFVGDGEVILGKLNPDFINCNGKKQIIELFGCWYHACSLHHPNNEVSWQDTEVGKKVIFSRYGFKTLVIWEHELSDEKAVIGKVSQFMARTLTK